MAVIRLPARKASGASLTDQAYQLVKQRILSNRLPGGVQVLEEELAGQLKMSRTPLRDAILDAEPGLFDDECLGVCAA